MKKTLALLCLALATLTNGCVFGQESVWTHPWSATIKVVDENSQPVAAAEVEVSYYVQPPPGENEAGASVHGLTDTNGIIRLSHPATGSTGLGFQVSKPGYYPTTIGHEFAKSADSDPQKWNPDVTLVLKQIAKPIPMYAKKILSLTLPEFNKAIGYDLMTGDWVAPYGKGVNSDIFFTETHTNAESGYILSVSFPKPGDGIQEFSVPDAEKGSALRSPHEAPINGYQPEIAQTEMTNPNRNFFFRVRTVLDENGNVKSALYGKIYGDLAQFTYYLDPTPNDRNIEFDPKHNLLGGMQSFEQVSIP